VTDFGFTGQRFEAGFGLADYKARYYDPYLGRFISADTIVPEPGNPQSLNRFSYVSNNPIRHNDPTGHQPPPDPEEFLSILYEDMSELGRATIEVVRILTPDAVKVEAGGSIIFDTPPIVPNLPGINGEGFDIGGTVDIVASGGELAVFNTTPQVNAAPASMEERSLGLIPFVIPSAEGGGSAGLVWSTNNLQRGIQTDIAGPGIDVNPSLLGFDLIIGMSTDPSTGWPQINP
jgi:RHS repeat-associated protein